MSQTDHADIPSLRKPSTLLATWFGCGLLKPAPGTWGSLGAIPPALVIYFGGGILTHLIILCVITPIAFWATDAFEKASKTHDNKRIVIDEVIGQWIALLPIFGSSLMVSALPTMIWWLYVALSFILFRCFDILKPWPVSYCDQKISGATGVILDDIVAGIMAAILMIGAIYGYAQYL